jgi:cytochrome c
MMRKLAGEIAVLASFVPMLAVLMAARSFQEVAQPVDVEKGKAAFQRRCTGCHALDRDKEGPRLGGVYGRKAGSVVGFTYSDSLRGSTVVWDQTSLDSWLTNPEALVPGNDMGFLVKDPEERAEIVRYLRVASGK